MSSYLEKQKKSRHKIDTPTIRRVGRSFKPYRWQVTLVLIAILLTTGLGVITPLLIQRIFDDIVGAKNLTLLVIYISIMIAIPVITSLIDVYQAYLNNMIGQSVMRDFRNRLYKHLQGMSLHFFTGTKTGEIQSRLSNDINGVQGVITNTATSIVSNVATIVSTIAAMLVINPLLTFISLGLLPVFVLITAKVGNVRRTTSKETQESMASLTAMMLETLSVSGILQMKTFGRQKYARELFEQENQRLTNLEIRQQLIGRWFFMFMNAFFSITPASAFLIGGWQIITRPHFATTITLGGIVAFTTLQSRLFSPAEQLLSTQVKVQGALALFDRIFEYLDLPIDIQDAPEALRLDPAKIRGRITFDNVSFTYKREHPLLDPVPANTVEEPRTTLKDISFDIQPGQLAALVGPSGAGKTTITYMVPRLYDVDEGAVKIDGHNVRDLQLTSLGELVGMVTQETYLFHASVRENLLYARQEATEEEIIAATKAAAIHERIMELEQGYDTIVGERGYKLSGGEKQRIAIARVILKNPRILILDEATSSLDTHFERLIQAALQPLMKGRTTLAIAHRLSTILAADIILVVDRGEIVEKGMHRELLEQGGLYARLYHEQFGQAAREEGASLS